LEELRKMKLTLSDLSVHGAHRDAIFLREHLSTHMKNALQLEKSVFEKNRLLSAHTSNTVTTDDDNTEVAVQVELNPLDLSGYSVEQGESKMDRSLEGEGEPRHDEYNIRLLNMSGSNFSELTHDITVASMMKATSYR